MQAETLRIPTHVGFIMDGNRRWAREHDASYEDAYHRGSDTLKMAVGRLKELGVRFVTAYTFSTENWNRPKVEVDILMRLFQGYLSDRIHELHENNVCFRALGQLKDFSKAIQKKLQELTDLTAQNDGITLYLALNYGGKAEIVDAVNSLLRSGVHGPVTPEQLQKNMYDPAVPPVDLIIRTSGEQRTSGFMLWHADYAELYFLRKNWPELTSADIDAAVEDYGQRKRNFGA